MYLKKSLAVTVCAFTICSMAQAETIDFAGISEIEGASFSSFSQSGFQVANIGGTWKVSQSGGDPDAAIYVPGNSGIGTISITHGGTDFRLERYDVKTAGGQSLIGIQAFSRGNLIFDSGIFYTAGLGLQTVDFGSFLPVADLVKMQTGDDSFDATFVDNIHVATVPEPSAASLYLMGLIFFGTLGISNRRKA